jgi:TolA-binding protein
MNEGTMDKPTFEVIEAYVLERLPAGERLAFEQRLEHDADLRDEVEMQREHVRAVELGGMVRLLQRTAQDERRAGAGGFGTYWKYAAAVALLVTAAAWLFLRTPVNEQLFATHFVADPGLPVAMGIAQDPAFADAMVHYKEGHYAEAIAAWTPLLHARPANDTLQFYLGAAALAEGDAPAARPHLQRVADDAASTFQRPARWYLFLAHVREGDRARAEAIDFGTDADAARRAAAILQAWPH